MHFVLFSKYLVEYIAYVRKLNMKFSFVGSTGMGDGIWYMYRVKLGLAFSY